MRVIKWITFVAVFVLFLTTSTTGDLEKEHDSQSKDNTNKVIRSYTTHLSVNYYTGLGNLNNRSNVRWNCRVCGWWLGQDRPGSSGGKSAPLVFRGVVGFEPHLGRHFFPLVSLQWCQNFWLTDPCNGIGHPES